MKRKPNSVSSDKKSYSSDIPFFTLPAPDSSWIASFFNGSTETPKIDVLDVVASMTSGQHDITSGLLGLFVGRLLWEEATFDVIMNDPTKRKFVNGLRTIGDLQALIGKLPPSFSVKLFSALKALTLRNPADSVSSSPAKRSIF